LADKFSHLVPSNFQRTGGFPTVISAFWQRDGNSKNFEVNKVAMRARRNELARTWRYAVRRQQGLLRTGMSDWGEIHFRRRFKGTGRGDASHIQDLVVDLGVFGI